MECPKVRPVLDCSPARAGSGLEFCFSSPLALSIVVPLCCLVFSGCHRKAPDPAASPPPPPPIGGAPSAPDRVTATQGVESTDLRQSVVEAKKLAAAGSYDVAAARLLKMRIDGTKFSDKDAAAYRDALQEAYSRALEAAANGDPKGKAALDMIRAARGR